MIVAEQARDVEQGGMGRTVQAKIKASRKLFSFFSDGVYSNKPVAIARELVANAVDSHVMAGRPDRPVEVTLPTAFDPIFTVRDFGTGMSEDFLFNNYLVYAEGSTKDGSNEAIGGFGIGKAAVFSYTDQFSLVSVQDGVKGVYSVFVGDDGIPAISQIAVTTTDEPNGVSISFPVQDSDIQLFAEAAQTALQYFRPLPLIENGTLNPPDYTFVGNNWALRNQEGALGVIVGGVRYPVTTDNLEQSLRNDAKLKPLLTYGIDLTLPIGSVGVALSREALSYDARTSANIRKALEGIFDDVKQTFGTMFDNAPTLWAAMKMLYKETGQTASYSRSARQQLLAANAVYKGKKLTTVLDVMGITGAKVWDVEPKRSWGRAKSIATAKWESFAEQRNLSPGTTEAVIIDNMPQTPKSKVGVRLKEYLTNATRSGNTIVIRPTPPINLADPLGWEPSKQKINDLLDALGNPEVTYTSDLALPPVTAAIAKAQNVRPKVRMFTWNGGKMPYTNQELTNLTPGAGKPVTEIKYADQPDTGIMVVMSNFDLPEGFAEKMATGVVAYNELHFINKTDEPKLDKWEKFEDVFNKRLPGILSKLPKDVNERLGLADAPEFGDIFRKIKHVEAGQKRPKVLTKLTDAQLGTPIGEIWHLWHTKVRVVDQDQRKFKPFLKPSLPAGVDPKALMAAFKKDQPEAALFIDMLQQIETSSWREEDRITQAHADLLVKLI